MAQSQALLAVGLYGPNASDPVLYGVPTVPRDALIYLSASFFDGVTGTLADPDSVYISASAPDATSASYVNTASSTPVYRSGVGVYFAFVDVINGAGQYWWKWQSKGQAQGAMVDASFVVASSVFPTVAYILIYRGSYSAGLGDASTGLGYMQLGST